MKSRNVYIIAGPNGSGKTTFASKFLPEYAKCQNFINADLIAGGLSPFSPSAAAIKAGKLVLSQIDEYAKMNIDFAFESTLAGKSHVNLFKKLKAKGYKIHIFFLWIPDAKLAIARVRDRVKEGGHDVPIQDIKRRFRRSISNFFKLYQSSAYSWLLFDNAHPTPALIAKRINNHTCVVNKPLFDMIGTLAR